jgi:hypothetical protein
VCVVVFRYPRVCFFLLCREEGYSSDGDDSKPNPALYTKLLEHTKKRGQQLGLPGTVAENIIREKRLLQSAKGKPVTALYCALLIVF